MFGGWGLEGAGEVSEDLGLRLGRVRSLTSRSLVGSVIPYGPFFEMIANNLYVMCFFLSVVQGGGEGVQDPMVKSDAGNRSVCQSGLAHKAR